MNGRYSVIHTTISHYKKQILEGHDELLSSLKFHFFLFVPPPTHPRKHPPLPFQNFDHHSCDHHNSDYHNCDYHNCDYHSELLQRINSSAATTHSHPPPSTTVMSHRASQSLHVPSLVPTHSRSSSSTSQISAAHYAAYNTSTATNSNINAGQQRWTKDSPKIDREIEQLVDYFERDFIGAWFHGFISPLPSTSGGGGGFSGGGGSGPTGANAKSSLDFPRLLRQELRQCVGTLEERFSEVSLHVDIALNEQL